MGFLPANFQLAMRLPSILDLGEGLARDRRTDRQTTVINALHLRPMGAGGGRNLTEETTPADICC